MWATKAQSAASSCHLSHKRLSLPSVLMFLQACNIIHMGHLLLGKLHCGPPNRNCGCSNFTVPRCHRRLNGRFAGEIGLAGYSLILYLHLCGREPPGISDRGSYRCPSYHPINSIKALKETVTLKESLISIIHALYTSVALHTDASTGKIIVGLVLHWLYITDSVVISTYRLNGLNERWASPTLHSYVGHGILCLMYVRCFCVHWTWVVLASVCVMLSGESVWVFCCRSSERPARVGNYDLNVQHARSPNGTTQHVPFSRVIMLLNINSNV